MKRAIKNPTKAEQAGVRFDFDIQPVPGLEKTFAGADGNIYSTRLGSMRAFRAHDNGRGYLRAMIHGKLRLIHVLVCTAFHGPKGAGLEVNHKDGNKKNNRPENLEFVTRSQNIKHSFDTGLREPYRRASHPYAKLNEETAMSLRNEYFSLCVDGRLPRGEGKRMASKYGVNLSYIRVVATGEAWP